MTTEIKTALSWCPSWSTPGKPCPVRPRCLFSWEYLWKDSWGLPMRAKSSKQRCPALCLFDLSYNVKYHWSCRVGGCYSHLTASGSWQGFPGVDHEGHQDSAVVTILDRKASPFCICEVMLWKPSGVAFCDHPLTSWEPSGSWLLKNAASHAQLRALCLGRCPSL